MLLNDQKKKPISKVPIQNIENNTPVDNENDVDFQIEMAGSKNDDGDVIYVKYVPLLPDNPVPPMHPRDRLKQRVKKIRQEKEKYRVNAKKKAIKYLNKRKAEMFLKDHINKQKIDPPTQEDQLKIAEPYLVINKNLFKKKILC